MKKSTLLLAALTLVSGSAFASKARMAALSNAAYLTTDTQSIFDNVARITQIGDYATFELGAASSRAMGANTLESDFNATSAVPGLYPGATGTPRILLANSEGGFVTSHGDSKFGFYVGRKSQFTTLARGIGGFLGQENSIEAMYGMKADYLSWGVSVNYSTSDKKANATPQKQNAAGVRLGLVAPNWDAFAVIGLSSSADGSVKTAGVAPTPTGGTLSFGAINDSAATYRGTSGYKVGGGYWLNTMYINGNYYQDGAKIEYGAAPGGGYSSGATYLAQINNVEQKHAEIGVIDTVKNDSTTFFYGGYYAMDNARNKEVAEAVDAYKVDKTSLPFLMGMEVQANTWLTVRGSVKQNVILGSKKSQGGDANTIDNNTTAAAGVGMKWSKVTVDAMIAKTAAGTSGDINENNFLSNASMTYWF